MKQQTVSNPRTGSRLRCGIVLAGGDGTRLRSFVQRTCGTALPKQYVNLIGTRSMLEHTFRRAERLIRPERLFTVVSAHHLSHFEVRRQLAGRPPSTVVIQPENKETAPGLLLPLMHLAKRYPRATVAVFPSDHFILEDDLFMTHVYLAFRLVEKEPSRLVLLGVRPERAESDYGYILPGSPLPDLFPLGVRKISAFIEKPEPASARKAIQNGGLWNTMVMVFQPEILLNRIGQIASALYESFQRIAASVGKPNASQVVREVYRDLEPVNFSKALLEHFSGEHPPQLTVLPVRGVHWSDWGSERRILASLKRIGDRRSLDRATRVGGLQIEARAAYQPVQAKAPGGVRGTLFR